MADVANVVVNTNPPSAAPCAITPCSQGRLFASPTPLIIVLIILPNYVTVVVYGLAFRADAARIFVVAVFHLCLVMMTLAWLMVCCTDPGVPTVEWQREMADRVSRGTHTVPICRKSGLYKPPRSHFDSVTQRLTLNMDHFCPWVVNTVGFYNRKFFLLFLLYVNTALAVSALTLVAYAYAMWDWLNSDEVMSNWLPDNANVVLHVAAFGLDVVLLSLLAPFASLHVRMAMRNQTTIEPGPFADKYDVGTLANLRSVFGRRMWTWPLPLYCDGPEGDGLSWPTRERRTSTDGGGTSGGSISDSSSGGGGGGGGGDGVVGVILPVSTADVSPAV